VNSQQNDGTYYHSTKIGLRLAKCKKQEKNYFDKKF